MARAPPSATAPSVFGKIGRKGGKAVSEKYGPGHFERIGRRGGQKVASLVERAKTLEGQDEQAKPAPEVRVEESIGA
ncbi:MAG TPA: Em GEA1 (EM1) [Candidatus Limnocylindria bacterium]